MPERLFPEPQVAAADPMKCSLVAFHLHDKEQLFFSWSPLTKNGPAISRTGTGPPSMRTVWNIDRPWGRTTDAEEMRNWCDYIENDGVEVEDLLSAGMKPCDPDAPAASMAHRRLFQDRVLSARRDRKRVHTVSFGDRYPGFRPVGQVGCGDTTMNQWHVAYVKPRHGPEEFLYLDDEPLRDRQYTCLVKWKDAGRAGSVTFEESVRLTPGPQPAIHVVENDEKDSIEFAVSGKPVMDALGRAVPRNQVTHYFRDLRHLFSLPKLTPLQGELPVSLFGEPIPPGVDLWLGEKQLLDDANLQRAACVEPVLLDRLYGGLSVTREHLRKVLKRSGYEEASGFVRWRPGHYRVEEDGTGFEVFFKPAIYPWNILALGTYLKSGRKGQGVMLSFACGGLSGRSHFTLDEAAKQLAEQAELHDILLKGAMLLDEGGDVFQQVDFGSGLRPTPLDPVPNRSRLACQRRLVRCCFFFAVGDRR